LLSQRPDPPLVHSRALVSVLFAALPFFLAANPPATDPPATDPPATDPPATDPPATDSTVAPCRLVAVDDRSEPISETLTLCLAGVETCSPFEPSSSEVSLDSGQRLTLEGPRHGPATAQIERLPRHSGVCSIVVPCKARVQVATESTGPKRATSSFYAAATGDLDEPMERLPFGAAGEVFVPAGSYVVSLSSPGWAPDLHWLAAAPGSEHSLRFPSRPGGSFVVRATRPDGDPVSNVQIDLYSVPGLEPVSASSTRSRLIAARWRSRSLLPGAGPRPGALLVGGYEGGYLTSVDLAPFETVDLELTLALTR
jgi:hypothetical protein